MRQRMRPSLHGIFDDDKIDLMRGFMTDEELEIILAVVRDKKRYIDIANDEGISKTWAYLRYQKAMKKFGKYLIMCGIWSPSQKIKNKIEEER